MTGSGLEGLILSFEALAKSFFGATTSSFLAALTYITSGTWVPLVYLLSGTATTFFSVFSAFFAFSGFSVFADLVSAVFGATSSFLVLDSASITGMLFSLSSLESAASRLAIVLVTVL